MDSVYRPDVAVLTSRASQVQSPRAKDLSSGGLAATSFAGRLENKIWLVAVLEKSFTLFKQLGGPG